MQFADELSDSVGEQVVVFDAEGERIGEGEISEVIDNGRLVRVIYKNGNEGIVSFEQIQFVIEEG